MKCTTKSVAAASAALLLGGAARAATSGDFTVLTMNVAGLPEILNGNDVPGDRTANSRTMGAKFAAYNYDVIHVQEDFNYHAYIYETDNHPYRTATSGGVPFGSGLNTLANFDWINYERVKWDTCSNASGADCLTPKGFTFMRAKVDEGVYVDFYNLHTDAGTEEDDLRARAANLRQVSDYIGANSAGNAVVLFGDTNSRYSRPRDGIPIFRQRNAMTDAWVELQRGGVEPTAETLCANPSADNTCETVDKVFYRGSPLVALRAVRWGYESARFLQDNGDLLSDHNPIAVNFTWAAGAALRQSDFWGGPHGAWFSDVPALAALSRPKPATLTFRGADRVDGLGLALADGTALVHGGTGGSPKSLALAADEYWTGARLCQGQKNQRTRIFYIRATTSTGRTLEVGQTTPDCRDSLAPEGWHITGFVGQDGDEIDQLAFVYAPR